MDESVSIIISTMGSSYYTLGQIFPEFHTNVNAWVWVSLLKDE